jgi:hypothetical protein
MQMSGSEGFVCDERTVGGAEVRILSWFLVCC